MRLTNLDHGHSLGTKVLFVYGLANFRSIGEHFVQPLVFSQSAPLVLAVQCQNTGGKACTVKVAI